MNKLFFLLISLTVLGCNRFEREEIPITPVIYTSLDEPLVIRSIDSVDILGTPYPRDNVVCKSVDVDRDGMDDFKFCAFHEYFICQPANYQTRRYLSVKSINDLAYFGSDRDSLVLMVQKEYPINKRVFERLLTEEKKIEEIISCVDIFLTTDNNYLPFILDDRFGWIRLEFGGYNSIEIREFGIKREVRHNSYAGEGAPKD